MCYDTSQTLDMFQGKLVTADVIQIEFRRMVDWSYLGRAREKGFWTEGPAYA